MSNKQLEAEEMAERESKKLSKEIKFSFGLYHAARFISFELCKLNKIKSWAIMLLLPILFLLYICIPVNDGESKGKTEVFTAQKIDNNTYHIEKDGIKGDEENEWMKEESLTRSIIEREGKFKIIVTLIITIIINVSIAFLLHKVVYNLLNKVKRNKIIDSNVYNQLLDMEEIGIIKDSINKSLGTIQKIINEIDVSKEYDSSFLQGLVQRVKKIKTSSSQKGKKVLFKGLEEIDLEYEKLLELQEIMWKYKYIIEMNKSDARRSVNGLEAVHIREKEISRLIERLDKHGKYFKDGESQINEILNEETISLKYLKRLLVASRVQRKPKKFTFTELIKRIGTLAITPDLFFAKKFKEKIEEDTKTELTFENLSDENIISSLTNLSSCTKEHIYKDKEGVKTYIWNLIRIDLKFYIEWCNWTNILFSLLYLTIAYCLINSPYSDKSFLNVNVSLSTIIIIALLLRILSRGVEVAYAFYKDVTSINSKVFYSLSDKNYKIYIDKFNKSLLRNRGRLSLALHTLIEMFVLYGTAYYLLFSQGSRFSLHIFEALLFSTSLGLFNFSYYDYGDILLSMLHVSQVIISVVLILLSIALYLSQEILSDEEKTFYAEVAKRLSFIKLKN